MTSKMYFIMKFWVDPELFGLNWHIGLFFFFLTRFHTLPTMLCVIADSCELVTGIMQIQCFSVAFSLNEGFSMINFKNDTPTFLLSPLLDQDPILKCDESISLGHEAVFSTACETLLSARRSSVRQPQTHQMPKVVKSVQGWSYLG